MAAKFLPERDFKSLYENSEVSQLVTTQTSLVELTQFEAIKTASLDWILVDICFLLQTSSQYVIGLHNYTIEVDADRHLIGRYSMPLGKPVKSLSVKQLFRCISDLISACLYLQAHHLVHADLKPENIVYLPATKRYVLIDLGLCRRIFATPEGPMFEGIAYTLPFRDFQFYGNLNPVSCEVFALGQTIRSLALGISYIYDTTLECNRFLAQLRRKFPREAESNLQRIANFVELTTGDPESRPSLQELAEQFQADSFNQVVAPVIPPTAFGLPENLWYETISWLIFDYAAELDLSVQCVFLALTNIHRCRPLIQIINFRAICSLNLYLAALTLKTTNNFTSEVIRDSQRSLLRPEEITQLLPHILEHLGFQILVSTLWDSTGSLQAFTRHLSWVLNPHYTSTQTPAASSRCLISNMKLVLSRLKIQHRVPTSQDLQRWVLNGYVEMQQPSPLWSTQASFVSLETPSTRQQIQKSLRSVGVAATLEAFFNPEEDVGFVYLYQDLLHQNSELLYQVIDKISQLPHQEQTRYLAVIKPEILKIFLLTPVNQRRQVLNRYQVFQAS